MVGGAVGTIHSLLTTLGKKHAVLTKEVLRTTKIGGVLTTLQVLRTKFVFVYHVL